MTDNADVPVVSDVADVVDEVVPDPIEQTADDTLEGMPPWGQEILDRVDALTEQVTALVPVVTPEEVTEPVTGDHAPEDSDLPADGHIVKDESPVKVPWTHKKLWN